jgi:CRISPR-associated protein Cas1
MKAPIYLFDPVRLRRKDNTLHFEYGSRKSTYGSAAQIAQEEWEAVRDQMGSDMDVRPAFMPIERVDSIHVYTDADLNTALLHFLSEREIPIHFHNAFGSYTGSFIGRSPFPNGRIRLAQWALHEDVGRRVSIAREMTAGANHNLHRTIGYYVRRNEGDRSLAESFSAQAARLDACRSLDEIRGVEGTCRRIWYFFMDSLLDEEMRLDIRSYHPPTNPVNALLSFLNGMVYSTVISEVHRTQLDPTIGILHAHGRHAYPLAYDLADVFKPILSDGLLVSMIRKNRIKADDFEVSLNGSVLTREGRAKVVRAFEERLRTTIHHRKLDRSVSYRRLIRLECYKLVKHLVEGTGYEAFRAWW